MKNYLSIIFFILLCNQTIFAQKGLFAGSSKNLIGKKHNFEIRDLLFKNYKNIGGYFLTFQDGSGIDIMVDFYQKGKIQIVVLLSKEENSEDMEVQDIVEIKNMPPRSYIQSATCAQGNRDPDIEIIALEQELKGKGKIIKAWRASRDKLHFSAISTKGINCVMEGVD